MPLVTQQPKPITFDLVNDFVQVEESQGYQNPFTTSLPKDEIVIEVEVRDQSYHKRKWRVEMDTGCELSIKQAREKYVQYLKRTNGSANKEVWQVYEHLAADLFNDVMRELMGKIDKDLDLFCEKVIYDEF